MNNRKNVVLILGFALSFSLVVSALAAGFTADFYKQAQFEMLGNVCMDIIDKQPDANQAVSAALKEYKSHPGTKTGETLLSAMGYEPSDFLDISQPRPFLIAAISFISGAAVLLLTLWYRHRSEVFRINALSDYLETVNTGGQGLLLQSKEDEFSKLQDEIYKTVTMLYQTREDAVASKHNYAENLANIAHQLKTPITAISLCTQMMKNSYRSDYPAQIQRQLSRLTHLEESLLLLSRIDAGTLILDKKAADVFTILTLAADNLQELLIQSQVSVDIPELGQMEITADLDWTMEAFMNLMKNCMEHTSPGGMVHCSYEKNPLYTEIRIWDEGKGFALEDIPHLFERFYRGQNAKEGGIGIGLSLAKELIEKQNGTIRACNLPDSGACFEIRFYCH